MSTYLETFVHELDAVELDAKDEGWRAARLDALSDRGDEAGAVSQTTRVFIGAVVCSL